MRVVSKRIPTFVIKLIKKSNRNRAQNTHGEGRKKIPAIDVISDPRPDHIGDGIYHEDDNGGYNEIAWFQIVSGEW